MEYEFRRDSNAAQNEVNTTNGRTTLCPFECFRYGNLNEENEVRTLWIKSIT